MLSPKSLKIGSTGLLSRKSFGNQAASGLLFRETQLQHLCLELQIVTGTLVSEFLETERREGKAGRPDENPTLCFHVYLLDQNAE